MNTLFAVEKERFSSFMGALPVIIVEIAIFFSYLIPN